MRTASGKFILHFLGSAPIVQNHFPFTSNRFHLSPMTALTTASEMQGNSFKDGASPTCQFTLGAIWKPSLTRSVSKWAHFKWGCCDVTLTLLFFQIKKYYDATVLDWHALRLDQFVVEVPLHDLKLPKASLRTKCTRTMVAPSGCTSFDSVNAVVKSSVSVAICFLRRGNKECTLAKLRSLTRWYTGMSQLCYFSNHSEDLTLQQKRHTFHWSACSSGPPPQWTLLGMMPRIPRTSNTSLPLSLVSSKTTLVTPLSAKVLNEPRSLYIYIYMYSIYVYICYI